MGKKSYPNRSAAEILGKKKYPAENLGTKKYPLRFGYQKYPPRFWVPKSNKIKGKIERGRAKTLNFRACGGLKANISLIHLSLNRREASFDVFSPRSGEFFLGIFGVFSPRSGDFFLVPKSKTLKKHWFQAVFLLGVWLRGEPRGERILNLGPGGSDPPKPPSRREQC